MAGITDKDILNFEKDGVIKVEGVLSLDQLEELDRALTHHLSRNKLLNKLIFGDSLFYSQPNPWKSNPYFREFIQQPMFIDLAAQLLRSSRINLLQDVVFIKVAGSRKKFLWHHDRIYTPIQGEKVVTFWMAPENVTLHSGGIEFIKGSHRWTEDFGPPPSLSAMSKLLPQYWWKTKKTNLGYRTVEEADAFSEDNVVSLDLKRGDILAFNGDILHRSGPNLSDGIDRKGYSVRYAGDDIKYHPDDYTAISYQWWATKLDEGEKLKGSLFPLLYDNGKHLELDSARIEKGRIWRVLQNKILTHRNKSNSNSS
jgi:ectoine hydroxylase-related dioxygenase (phytanoyl-CoA dioxygenase family)